LSHFSYSHVNFTGDKRKPDTYKAEKMDDDKIPTLYMQLGEQLRPFMSTRQRVGRQRNRGSILGKNKGTYFSSKLIDRFCNLLNLSRSTGDALPGVTATGD
jgi:hypothetical protein